MVFFDEHDHRIRQLLEGVLGGIFVLLYVSFPTLAQEMSFGLNLGSGSEAIQIEADGMEMRDREGVAIFTGNVSLIQGDRVLRAGKMTVHYDKPQNAPQQAEPAQPPSTSSGRGLGGTDIKQVEVENKVYIKSGTQVATGDHGAFDAKSNTMVMSGERVVLIDGDNVATGCKLTAHMDTGRAFLEGCQARTSKERVSIIMNRND